MKKKMYISNCDLTSFFLLKEERCFQLILLKMNVQIRYSIKCVLNMLRIYDELLRFYFLQQNY